MQCLPKSLRAEFSYERQPRGSEEHFLAHGRRIGNVRDSDKPIGRVFEPQDDVIGNGGKNERRQDGKVVEKGWRIAGDCFFWNERLALNAGKETPLRGGRH